MRQCLLFICILYSALLFSQSSKLEKNDSVAYYLALVKYNKTLNNYKNCLNYSQKALDIAKKNNDQKAIANSYSNLGVVYLEIKKFDDALEVLDKSISVFSTLEPSSQQAFTYYNLGICYLEKNNYLMAERNFETSKSIYEKLKISAASEMINLQEAKVYFKKGKFNLANNIFESLLITENPNGNSKIKSEALYYIGKIEIEKKRFNLALNYLEQAYTISNEDKNIDLKSKILLSLSVVYENSNNLKKSNFLLKQHLKLKDSLLEINNNKIDVQDFESFKNSEKLRLIEQIDRDNKNNDKANSFAKLISILAIALISILSLLSLSLYKNNILRNQSNALLQEKNNELLKAKEDAEKASKARTEFLSTVSHELRTPLNAINGITHLLLEENPKKEQLEYLNSLQFSGNYLLTFINDILEINRIESNNIPVEGISFNLKSLLFNIQNSLKEIALENKNTFLLEVDEKIPSSLIGDTTKLSQIFMNLINNSLKFTKNGYVKVEAKINSFEQNNLRIDFKVSDNGIGIPEDKQQEIFNSFSQGSIEINRKYGGTGLGLTIVKRLIELLGGTISLNSKVGLGSTFSFSLPFQIDQEIIAPIKKIEFDESKVYDKKILLVEDNKINQMITKKMLENKGMFCKIVDNGEESVALLKEINDYDLVLMDVHLPGINGTIATQQIREFNTSLPIIALTAISLNENREMLLSYGMTDVITKPFEPEKFYKIISENLS